MGVGRWLERAAGSRVGLGCAKGCRWGEIGARNGSPGGSRLGLVVVLGVAVQPIAQRSGLDLLQDRSRPSSGRRARRLGWRRGCREPRCSDRRGGGNLSGLERCRADHAGRAARSRPGSGRRGGRGSLHHRRRGGRFGGAGHGRDQRAAGRTREPPAGDQGSTRRAGNRLPRQGTVPLRPTTGGIRRLGRYRVACSEDVPPLPRWSSPTTSVQATPRQAASAPAITRPTSQQLANRMVAPITAGTLAMALASSRLSRTRSQDQPIKPIAGPSTAIATTTDTTSSARLLTSRRPNRPRPPRRARRTPAQCRTASRVARPPQV